MEARVHLNSPASHPRMNPNTHQIGGWIIPRIRENVFGEDKNLSPLPGFEPCTFQLLALPATILKETVTSNHQIPIGTIVNPPAGWVSLLSLIVGWGFCLRIRVYISWVRTPNFSRKKTLLIILKLLPVSHQYNTLTYLNNLLPDRLYEQNI